MRQNPIHLTINCHYLRTVSDIHTHIAHVLHFPAYYGANLDALRDCLNDVLVEHSVSFTWKDTPESSNNTDIQLLKKTLDSTIHV